jgi:Sec-independent protein translocase protein TatA
MKGLGTGLREFKKAARNVQEDIGQEAKQIEKPKPTDNTTKS